MIYRNRIRQIRHEHSAEGHEFGFGVFGLGETIDPQALLFTDAVDYISEEHNFTIKARIEIDQTGKIMIDILAFSEPSKPFEVDSFSVFYEFERDHGYLVFLQGINSIPTYEYEKMFYLIPSSYKKYYPIIKKKFFFQENSYDSKQIKHVKAKFYIITKSVVSRENTKVQAGE